MFYSCKLTFVKIVTPGDIAIYGVLCSLATKSRSAIKASIMESPTFGVYLEHEPYVRDLVDAYMASKFKTVLDILEQYSVRLCPLLLDFIHLTP